MLQDQMTRQFSFRCCFCNENIQENKVNPVDINIILNEDMQKKTGASQNFYAHFNCFKEKLHAKIQGYFVHEDE